MAIDDAVELGEDIMVLSNVGKTVDGAGYAFTQLECVGKRVGEIEILKEYEALRQIDLSRNRIRDVAPLSKLAHVLRLNLSNNAIESLDAWGKGVFSHLLYLDLSGNKLTALPQLNMPALKRANFSMNLISTCEDFRGHQRLQALDLSQNSLCGLTGLCDMPALEVLKLSQNSLASLDGLRALPALSSLDLASNSLDTLAGPWEETVALRSLDVSSNKVAADKALQPLSRLPELRQIQVAGNPLEEQEGINVRLEVIIYHPRLDAINGEEVTEEEREEAKVLNERRIEEERERMRAAEEARREAEEVKR